MIQDSIPGPRTLVDLFDEAFDLYKRNAGLFLLVILAVHIPGWIALTAFGYELFKGIEPSRDTSQAFDVIGRSIVFCLAFFLVYLLQAAPLTVAVSDRYLGQTCSFKRAYRGMLRTYPRLLVTGFIVFMIGLIGTIVVIMALLFALGIVVGGAGATGPDSPLVIAAAIIVLAGMALVIPALAVWILPYSIPGCIIERLGPFGSLARNGMLASSGYWRVFRAMFLLPAIWLTIVLALEESGDFIWGYLISPMFNPSHLMTFIFESVWRTATITFVNPMVIIFLTLLYYDARVRREGFDLALLHRRLQEQEQLSQSVERAPVLETLAGEGAEATL